MTTTTTRRSRAQRAQNDIEALDRARSGSSDKNDIAVMVTFDSLGIDWDPPAMPRENCLTMAAWRAAGRRVCKGERPVRPILETIIPAKDRDGSPKLDEDGKPITFCKAGPVSLWHISQTRPAEEPADEERRPILPTDAWLAEHDPDQAAEINRRRFAGARFGDFAGMDSRRDSVGCINGADHQIRRGDRIGWSRKHGGACCASCWARWTAENYEAARAEAYGV